MKSKCINIVIVLIKPGMYKNDVKYNRKHSGM